jgi:hypothetical protein
MNFFNVILNDGCGRIMAANAVTIAVAMWPQMHKNIGACFD